MMPKGVEHIDVQEVCANDEVRIPMMPKGVEHMSGWFFSLR